MKLFIYRTFTWTTIFVAANTVSFIAGAMTYEGLINSKKKDAPKQPEETPVP